MTATPKDLQDEVGRLFNAVDRFIEVTQERSKVVGYNRMLAPDEYVEMLAALVEVRKALQTPPESAEESDSICDE